MADDKIKHRKFPPSDHVPPAYYHFNGARGQRWRADFFFFFSSSRHGCWGVKKKKRRVHQTAASCI